MRAAFSLAANGVAHLRHQAEQIVAARHQPAEPAAAAALLIERRRRQSHGGVKPRLALGIEHRRHLLLLLLLLLALVLHLHLKRPWHLRK